MTEPCAQSMRLVFRNGRRNMHLQGGGWRQPGDAPCEFDVRLFFDGATPEGAREVELS